MAGLIAGHGHGAGGAEGITGIAPGARILSVQVTLEYNDPLDSDRAVTGQLPAAIAAGIRYAVAHGATVISLPLDPSAMGGAGAAPAAADRSQAERAAVEYAISRGVLLVAPAGDNGDGGNAVNYPAAYPGVLAVGATARDGDLAPFTNTGSYVALTAPGAAGPAVAMASGATAGPPVGLTVAAPDGGYQTLASTDMASALTAGVAALIRGRYPWLTAAEVAGAIEDGATAPASGSAAAGSRTVAGRGHGALNAGTALARAAAVAAAHPRPAPSTPTPTAQPRRPHADAHPACRGQARQPGRDHPLGPALPAHRRLRPHRGPDLRADRDLAAPPGAVGPGRRRRPRRPQPRPRPSLARPAAGRSDRAAAARPRPAPDSATGRHRRGQRLGERQPERPAGVRPGGGRAAGALGAVAVGVRVGAGPQGAAAVAVVKHRPDVRMEPGRDHRSAPPGRRRRSRALARTGHGFHPDGNWPDRPGSARPA